MLCPHCNAPRSKVTDSRPSGPAVRRRRQCRKCGHTWTSYEVPGQALAGLRAFDTKIKPLLRRLRDI